MVASESRPIEPRVDVDDVNADGAAAAEVEPERHGKVVRLDPPEPPARDEYDVWGDVEGTPVGEVYGAGGLGCPRGVEPSPPSSTRHGRRPVARLRSLEAEGALSHGAASSSFRGRADSLRDCQLAAMEEQPELAGRLRLRIDIGADGRVLTAASDGLDAIAGCVREVALRWRFAPADAGSRIAVEFDLRTEPAAPERPRPPSCRR